MKYETIKNILSKALADKDIARIQITSTGTGCRYLNKGRGANSFLNVMGIDLTKVKKTSVYEARVGAVNYQMIKESNGYGSTVEKKIGDYSFVEGFEDMLAINNKTGEVQLRYFVYPDEDKHISTVYKTADGEEFQPWDKKYEAYRATLSDKHEGEVSIRYIGIDKISRIKVLK